MRKLVVRLIYIVALLMLFLLSPLTTSAHITSSKVAKPSTDDPSTWQHVRGVQTSPAMQFHGNSKIHPNGTEYRTSSNYAGWYDGDGSANFNYVQGNWSNPCTAQPVDNAHQLTQWVGIGGIHGNKNLLQVGTWLRPDGTWHLFFELFGSTNSTYYYPTFSNETYQCGDNISAEADYNYNSTGTYKNHVFLQIKARDNQTVLKTLDYMIPDSSLFVPDVYSADWIDERPGCKDFFGNQQYTYLPNFHTTHWSNGHANKIGYGIGAIGNFQNTNDTMHDSTVDTLAFYPGGATPTSFTNQWSNFGADGYSCG